MSPWCIVERVKGIYKYYMDPSAADVPGDDDGTDPTDYLQKYTIYLKFCSEYGRYEYAMLSNVSKIVRGKVNPNTFAPKMRLTPGTVTLIGKIEGNIDEMTKVENKSLKVSDLSQPEHFRMARGEHFRVTIISSGKELSFNLYDNVLQRYQDKFHPTDRYLVFFDGKITDVSVENTETDVHCSTIDEVLAKSKNYSIHIRLEGKVHRHGIANDPECLFRL